MKRAITYPILSSPQPPAITPDTTAPIISWILELSPTGGNISLVTQDNPQVTNTTFTGLQVATEYRVRVAGVNVRRVGDFSDTATAMTREMGVFTDTATAMTTEMGVLTDTATEMTNSKCMLGNVFQPAHPSLCVQLLATQGPILEMEVQ